MSSPSPASALADAACEAAGLTNPHVRDFVREWTSITAPARIEVIDARDEERLIAEALAADLSAHPDRLGFLRSATVGPSMRAVGWGKRALFGNARVRSLEAWPLRASGLAPDPELFDPATTWTMFAGGDMGVDRGMYKAVRILGKGVDFPFSGGTARISGTTCCSQFGWELPTVVPTGNAGAMRRLISGADVAIANLEGPVADRFSFHEHGTVFTGDPALLPGIVRAGIDVVTLANNHIGDAGRTGVVQSVRNVKRAGLLHAGAGANLAAARKPAWIETAGTRVAILSYDAIAIGWYAATASSPGSAPLVERYVRADIAAARKAGADVIVVWPHWGIEYTRGPSDFQRRFGHIAIDAGADLVIGNHPHWVGAVETYRGKPIWYALGNYTFDQRWSEPTLEGISLELTFRGRTLVQARMYPHVNILAVQPNLLDPAGSGKRVLDPVFAASPNLAW